MKGEPDGRAADVVVVGGGPAGAVAALTLAGRGLQVVVVTRGRQGAGDIVAGPGGAEAFERLGINLRALPASGPLDALDVCFGGNTKPVALGGVVVARRSLVAALRASMLAEGVVVVSGGGRSLRREGRWTTVRPVSTAGIIRAKHAIVATGPNLGRQTDDGAASGLVSWQAFQNVDIGRRAGIVLLAPRHRGANVGLGSLWVIPGHRCSARVVLVGRGVELRFPPGELAFWARRVYPQFDTAVRCGEVRSERWRVGFSPQGLADHDFLIVGGAAGLINPFTADGLQYAIDSATLAGAAIADHPDDPVAARRQYRDRLVGRFAGMFDSASGATRRYGLAWRVLADSVDTDSPILSRARRTLVVPGGLSRSARSRPGPADGRAATGLEMLLLACDEVLLRLRDDWPFLARVASAEGSVLPMPLRPSVLFGAASAAGGQPPGWETAPLAAAIELGFMGGLAFLALGPSPAGGPGRGTDWSLTGTVLTGDFLLAQASWVIAQVAPELCWAFAGWLSDLTSLRAARLQRVLGVPSSEPFSTLFEFPAQVGGLVGMATGAELRALREVGRASGEAFLRAEEILALQGQATRLDLDLEEMIRCRNSDIEATWLGVDCGSAAAAKHRAMLEATHRCQAAVRGALRAAQDIRASHCRALLERYVLAVAAPARGDRATDKVPSAGWPVYDFAPTRAPAAPGRETA